MQSGIVGMVHSLRSTFPDRAYWKTRENITFLFTNGSSAVFGVNIQANDIHNQFGGSYFTTQAEGVAVMGNFYSWCMVRAAKYRFSVALPPSTTITDLFAREIKMGFIPIIPGQAYIPPSTADTFTSTIMEQQGGIVSQTVDISQRALHFEFYLDFKNLTDHDPNYFNTNSGRTYSCGIQPPVSGPPSVLGGTVWFCNDSVNSLNLLVNCEITFYTELEARLATNLIAALTSASDNSALQALLDGQSTGPTRPQLVDSAPPDVLDRILALPPPGPLTSVSERHFPDPELDKPWGPDEKTTAMDYYIARAQKLRDTLTKREARIEEAFMKGYVPSQPFSEASESIEVDEE